MLLCILHFSCDYAVLQRTHVVLFTTRLHLSRCLLSRYTLLKKTPSQSRVALCLSSTNVNCSDTRTPAAAFRTHCILWWYVVAFVGFIEMFAGSTLYGALTLLILTNTLHSPYSSTPPAVFAARFSLSFAPMISLDCIISVTALCYP